MADIFLVRKPHITEKSMALRAGGTYVFIVKLAATKNEIKKSIKELYKVDVRAVRMINQKAKSKVFRGKVSFVPGYKKAMVTLAVGQSIDIQ